MWLPSPSARAPPTTGKTGARYWNKEVKVGSEASRCQKFEKSEIDADVIANVEFQFPKHLPLLGWGNTVLQLGK